MKARIRKKGEIINLAEYAKIELDVCDSFGNPIELKPEDVELIHDVKEDNFPNTDWNQVRIQAAIAAMQGMISNSKYYCTSDNYGNTRKDNIDYCARVATLYADELVEELKKGGKE